MSPAPLSGTRLQAPRPLQADELVVVARGYPLRADTLVPVIIAGEAGELQLGYLLEALKRGDPVEFIPALGGWPGELAAACAEQLPPQLAAWRAGETDKARAASLEYQRHREHEDRLAASAERRADKSLRRGTDRQKVAAALKAEKLNLENS